MTNKTRLEMGAKIIALVILGMLTIVTCAAIWNHSSEACGAIEPWVKWCAGALFACNAFAIFVFGKKVAKDYEHPEE